ncbi:MAG: Mur ligase family protein [Fuerstiella sp.]
MPASGSIALLGSRGAGMTALGEILADRGHSLIGFDQAVSAPTGSALAASAPLHTVSKGGNQTYQLPVSPADTTQSIQQSHLLQTHSWNWNAALAANSVVCICSPAVKHDDPLRQGFVDAGIPTISLHEALNSVFANCHQVCVAGTHGKSTTTSMLAWIMEHQGNDPGYFIGAKFQHSGRSGKSQKLISAQPESQRSQQQTAIIESCEFNRSFHQLSPSTIVLTGLERDHFDCFNNQQAEDDAFLKLLQRLPANGSVIYNADCHRTAKLVRAINHPSIACRMQGPPTNKRSGPSLCAVPHASESLTECQVANFQQLQFGIRFDVHFESQQVDVKLPVYGRHNATNAVQAIAAAVSRGLSLTSAAQALSSFPGIERRFQYRGSVRGMQLIDDYAHHPTAVRTTLQAARKKFPKQELRVCFEPHQLIRLAQLQDDFVDALSLADMVYVLPVLAARESASTSKCHQESHKLIIRLRSRGTSAFFSPNLDHVVRTVDHSANPNAVLLTMGAGSTHLIHDKLTHSIRRYSVA